MTALSSALPRPAQAMSAPQAGIFVAASLLLHALGAAGLLLAALSAPGPSRPTPMIELIAAPGPAVPPPAPNPPPSALAPAPSRPRIRPPPPAPRPQSVPPPPALVRDESAIAHADTLAAPTTDSAATDMPPSATSRPATQGVPGGTALSGLPGPANGAGLMGKLVSVTRLTRMPVLTVPIKPEYTVEMKRRNLTGKLKAKVLVDSDGKVKDAVVLSDPGHGTRESGLAALRKLEFEPGYADGAAVAVWIPFTFTFEWQE